MAFLYNALLLAVIVACWRRNAKSPSLRTVLTSGVGLAVVALLLAAVLTWAGRFQHFAFLAMLSCGVFIGGPVYLAGTAVVLCRSARRTAVLAAFGSLATVGIGIDAFFVEPHWLDVSHREIVSPKLARKVRIVIVADIQVDSVGDYEALAVRQAAEAKADLVLLAGDYVQVPWVERDGMRSRLRELFRNAGWQPRLGVFAIRGNVDDNQWFELFDGLGYQVIHETKQFDLGDLTLTCLSCDDSFNRGFALPASPADKFHLVMGHSPGFAMGTGNADLAVAGHTHGGQVQLPGFGPVTTLGAVPRKYGTGLVERPAGGLLLVSRGVGMERGGAPRLRFLCRPELAIVDLLPAQR